MTDGTTGEGLAPAEDATTTPVEAVEAAAEPAEGLEPEGEGEAARPKKTAKERIDELTAARRTAERDAEYWREQAMRAAPQPTAPAPQPVQGKPDPSQFAEGQYDPDYIEALTDWKVSRTIEARERQTSTRSAVQTFDERAAQMFPDGEPAGLIALRRAPSLPEAVQEIILTSENGPKLADYLGANPAAFNRLSAMSPPMQAYELAKIEQRLAAPTIKTNTTAPAPAPTARGTGGRFQVSPDTDDFSAFEKQYGA